MMDNSIKFKNLREKYKEFIYEDYEINENENEIYIEFKFEIVGLTKFNPRIKILKKEINMKNIDGNKIKNMAFHIGLIELISYWKCTCSPNVIIKCGCLNKEQIQWIKKLYFYGLGELFYTNNIETNINDFMNIVCCGESLNIEDEEDTLEGYIVPIGGGKDSIVTLETLNVDKSKDFCLIVNPKIVTLECAKIAGFKDKNIIEVYRTIDKNLIRT